MSALPRQPADQLFVLPHPERDLSPNGGNKRFRARTHLFHKIIGKCGGGGERHIQHTFAGEVGNVAGRQMNLRENLLHRLVLTGAFGRLILFRAHILLSERENLLNDPRAGREEHFTALIGGVRLILRLDLGKGGLFGVLRRGQLGLQRRIVRRGDFRQRFGDERRFRLVQLARNPLPAGAKDLPNGFPPEKINEPRKDQKIDNGIYKTHNHFVLFVAAFAGSPAVRCSISA